MKTILLFALVFGGIISCYSQINHNRKMEANVEQLSVTKNEKNAPFEKYKFADKLGSLKDPGWSRDFFSPIWPGMNMKQMELYASAPMPCVKPESIFPMRVYKPDPSIKYTMLFK